MTSRSIKIKDLSLSKIALGTWALGGGRDWGEPCSDTCALDTIKKSFDLGVNFIDTAPIYGLGRAQTLLGAAIKNKIIPRGQIVIATKCGLKPAARAVEFNLKPASVCRELEESLKTLNTDYIDIYLIHRLDRNTPLCDTLEELERQKQKGKIRHIGLCNVGPKVIEEAAKLTEIAAVQNEYSFLRRQEAQAVFEVCQTKSISFLAYGVLGGGVLSAKYKKEPNMPKNDARSFFYKFYKGQKFEEAKNAAAQFEKIAEKYNGFAAQAAINWVLFNPAVSCAICGARTPQQAEQNAKALNWSLTKEDYLYLETYFQNK